MTGARRALRPWRWYAVPRLVGRGRRRPGRRANWAAPQAPGGPLVRSQRPALTSGCGCRTGFLQSTRRARRRRAASPTCRGRCRATARRPSGPARARASARHSPTARGPPPPERTASAAPPHRREPLRPPGRAWTTAPAAGDGVRQPRRRLPIGGPRGRPRGRTRRQRLRVRSGWPAPAGTSRHRRARRPRQHPAPRRAREARGPPAATATRPARRDRPGSSPERHASPCRQRAPPPLAPTCFSRCRPRR